MAAEFFGNCQICGREHKASAAAIAKHGYTIRSGWQEGACYGSGGKPIQISCDLIQGAMDAANRYVEQANSEIAQLAANPLFDGGTVKMLVRTATRTGETYRIERATVELSSEGEPVARDAKGKALKSWPFYTGIKTVEAAAEELANMRIGYLTKTIDQSEENIVYLAERLKNWKPTELRPISAADKAAIAPKVHFAAKKYGYNATACASSAMGAQRMAGANTTANREEVTCAACLKAIKEADELPAKRAAEAEKNRAAAIRDAERDIKDYTKWLKTETDPMTVLRWSEDLTKATQRLTELKAQ